MELSERVGAPGPMRVPEGNDATQALRRTAAHMCPLLGMHRVRFREPPAHGHKKGADSVKLKTEYHALNGTGIVHVGKRRNGKPHNVLVMHVLVALSATDAKLITKAHPGIKFEQIDRVGKGVCPCCKRSFTNLRRHMTTKHPDVAKVTPPSKSTAYRQANKSTSPVSILVSYCLGSRYSLSQMTGTEPGRSGRTMMSVAMAERVAAALGGRVWTGDTAVRVYFGGEGRSASWLSSADDGSLMMQLGRGANRTDVERRLHDAGLVTGTTRETSYGATVLDDVRMVALEPAAQS